MDPLRETDRAFVFNGVVVDEGSRRVAIKILKERWSRDEKFMKAYLRQVEASALLPPHETLVPTLEFDYVAQRFFVVTEFQQDHIDCETIFMERKRLSYRTVLTAAKDVLTALAFAFKEGLRHRHLHPDDVLVHPASGRARILHFSTPPSHSSRRVSERRNFGVGADLLLAGILMYRLFRFEHPSLLRGGDSSQLLADEIVEYADGMLSPPLSEEERIGMKRLFVGLTSRDMNSRLKTYDEALARLDELLALDEETRHAEEKRRKERSRRIGLLQTAFDTVAALKGELSADTGTEGAGTHGGDAAPNSILDREEKRALLASSERSDGGRPNAAPRFEANSITLLLTAGILISAIWLVYLLFSY